MKCILMALSEASKIDFSGADKLAKTDKLIITYVKGKKTIPDKVQEELKNIKATIEYAEVSAATDVWPFICYLIGYHSASKHDVYVITKDKSKIPSKACTDIHVYVSFKSVGDSSSTTKKSTSTKKTSTSKKTTTTKKTTTKKTTSKKQETSVLDVVQSYVSGDSKKASESLKDLAGQFLGGK